VDCRQHGENVRAYVTLHSDAVVPTASELIAFTRNRIGYKAPEEMPLSPAGKTDRTTLKKMARTGIENGLRQR
jgi:long-chain acyl-CoA synthetase